MNFGKVQKNSKLHQNGFFATKAFNKGDIICTFSAKELLSSPTYLTIQVAEEVHITLSPTELENVNHSCDPNVFFNTTNMTLEALKDIHIHDELCFFYPSTEWKMDQPFVCKCGSPKCLINIQGAFYLNHQERLQYRFTDFIQQKLQLFDLLNTA